MKIKFILGAALSLPIGAAHAEPATQPATHASSRPVSAHQALMTQRLSDVQAARASVDDLQNQLINARFVANNDRFLLVVETGASTLGVAAALVSATNKHSGKPRLLLAVLGVGVAGGGFYLMKEKVHDVTVSSAQFNLLWGQVVEAKRNLAAKEDMLVQLSADVESQGL